MPSGQLSPNVLENTAGLRRGARGIGLGLVGYGVAGLLSPALTDDLWQPSLTVAVFFLLCGGSLFWQCTDIPSGKNGYGPKILGALAGASVVVGAVVAMAEPGTPLSEFAVRSPISLVGGLFATLSLITLGLFGQRGTLSWLSALGILSLAVFLLTDYLFAIGAPGYDPAYRLITFPTSVAFGLLGFGLLLANPQAPPLRALRSHGLAGLIARRLLPAALVLPLLLLWLLRIGLVQEIVDLSFGYSVVTAVLIVSLGGVILYQASALDRLEISARRELAESEAEYLRRLGHAIEAAELYVWEVEPHSGHVYYSENYLTDLGYETEHADSHLTWWSAIIDPTDLERVRAGWQRMLSGTQALFQTELRLRRKQGDVRWMHLRTKAIAVGEERAARTIVGILMDVTERHDLAERLEDTQAKLKLAMDIAAVGYWEKDLATGKVYYSPEWKRLLGYADHELTNERKEWISRLHPDDRNSVLAQLDALDPDAVSQHPVEFRLAHKAGGYRWIASRAVVSRDEEGVPVRLHGVHMDVTERKQIEQRIRRISQHDPLTGLPNRALIREFADPLLASVRRQGKLAAVLFIDMDRFKPINDTHGHEVGDEVLKEIALRLKDSVRETDLVGRYGGDEFLVVLADVASEFAVGNVAQTCLDRLSRPYRVRGLELHTSPSIGIGLFPRDGADTDALIRSADAAMYKAKEQGRNRFRFFR